jgi:anti-sigma regulatory factor (Ser/Thr protein kinase)
MANEIPIVNLADARSIVRARLEGRSVETAEIATLLTNELVSNAMQHGAGKPKLSLEIAECQLIVSVYDAGPIVDLVPLPIEPTRERGRGLAIVNALATDWGVDACWDGKVVWFSLDL